MRRALLRLPKTRFSRLQTTQVIELISARIRWSSTHEWEDWQYGSFNQFELADQHRMHEQTQPTTPITRSPTSQSLWQNFSSSDIDRAIETLSEHCASSRLQRFETVLKQRTANIRFVFENPTNTNNVWAALRTMDAFTIQNTDVILDYEQYTKGWRKSAMSEAMGAQKWLCVTQHSDTTQCLAKLKADGFTVLATDMQSGTRPMDSVDWSAHEKLAVVFGNERRGISHAARAAADERFYLPMRGFTQSLNLSVASAVVCCALDAHRFFDHDVDGGMGQGLSEAAKRRVLLTWLALSMKRSGARLRSHGFSISEGTLA